jgi:hypothetical protein
LRRNNALFTKGVLVPPSPPTRTNRASSLRWNGRPARAEYIPEVGAFAQHIYQDGAPFLSRNNGVFGLHMTWTVFEFGKRRGQASERTAEVAQAEENLARLRNRVLWYGPSATCNLGKK